MPNLWTHMLFGQEIAEKTKLNYREKLHEFNLGAQGPDPFFYHNFWPYKKDKSVSGIGSVIHKEHCGEFLIELLQYAKLHKSDPALTYYTFGFISHHILDRNAHPYIVYKSGEERNKHQVLETTIDTLLAKEFKGIKTWKTPIHKEITIPEASLTLIQKMINHTYMTTHHKRESIEQKFRAAYLDMIKALRILFDPTGIKNKLLGSLVSPFSHKKKFPSKDYLNKEHKEWLHPTDNTEKSIESFYDIYQRAAEEGIKVFTKIKAYFDDKGTIEQVKEVLGSISYETGKPCDQKLEFKYFDPII